MKLLIDECLPRTLKRLLGDHECRTVQEMGWSGKKNGVLLSLVELEFDVLVTVDQGIIFVRSANRRTSRAASTPFIVGLLTPEITKSSFSSLTFSNACLAFSASPQIPRESRVRRDRIPRRIASWSSTTRIHVTTPFALASASHSSRTT
jgi:predicted nuclease of predicted toxin-antitoxin system